MTLSDGDSLYSQPEKTRLQRPSGSSTSSWTKAPVSASFSHGAVVSQARRRTTTSLTRTDWPGRSAMSRTMPLRLLSRPSTATRSAIGVTPSAAPAAGVAAATLVRAVGCSAVLESRSQPAAHSPSATSKAAAGRTLSRVSRADSRRSPPGGSCRCRARRPAGTRPSSRSGWARPAGGSCAAPEAPCRAARRWCS